MTRGKPTTQAGARREQIDAVGALLTQASSALFITGPSLSAESGLANYRGFPGLVRKDPKDPDEGKRIEAVLSIDTLQRKPNLTWRTLLEMDHQRAGSRNVIEMHGALHDLLCTRCELSTRHDSYAQLPMPPLCATCGSVLRPDMPLFGESLPADPFTRLQAELDTGFDIVVAIGVATMLPYLARPVLLAKQEGVPTVEIGPAQTDVSDIVDFALRGSPAKILDLLWEVFAQLASRRHRAD
jgi:NAD-dependent deacetylase